MNLLEYISLIANELGINVDLSRSWEYTTLSGISSFDTRVVDNDLIYIACKKHRGIDLYFFPIPPDDIKCLVDEMNRQLDVYKIASV